MVYSSRPRIIKLHGSFPSQRPFVVTEEDYRRYPTDYAAFVNTVQQSLLENTLCLIGFSGDDPNFLRWIGWIRDNLGNANSARIYLIGLFDISEPQKKLLEQRNIVLVDLADCIGSKDDHSKALEFFIAHLTKKRELPDALGWPGKENGALPQLNVNEDSIRQIAETWRGTRNRYPNWVVLPEELRASLWMHTDHWTGVLKKVSELNPPFDIQFLYELNWRMERCLYPIPNDVARYYEKLVCAYNPFPQLVKDQSATVTPESHLALPWKSISQQWMELILSLLRYYRENGDLGNWRRTDEIIARGLPMFTSELAARYKYERCLFALFSLRTSDLRSRLEEWSVDEGLPFWEAKRAGLLAELGELSGAELILERSLSSIRQKLNLRPTMSDFTLVSQEAYTMQLLQYVKHAKAIGAYKFEGLDHIRDEFRERWNELKQYRCDPWAERKLFEANLEREPEYSPMRKTTFGFDVGHVTTTHHIGETDLEADVAYAFLRHVEECSMPFRISSVTASTKAAQGAIRRIADYSPYWAVATMIRTGEDKNIEPIYNRKSLWLMSADQADQIATNYLDVLNCITPDLGIANDFGNYNLAIRIAKILPEALSRLCVKCSIATRQRMLDFLTTVYTSPQKGKYGSIDHLFARLIHSYSQSELTPLVGSLIRIPVMGDTHPRSQHDLPEPFKYIQLNARNDDGHPLPAIDPLLVETLIGAVAPDRIETRARAATRLFVLNDAHLLTQPQRDGFIRALWTMTDEDGFPSNVDRYKFAFIDELHPRDVDVIRLFKDYVQRAGFPVVSGSGEPGIPISGGHDPLCAEILGATRIGDSIGWTKDEITSLFSRLVSWWDADKHVLLQEEREGLLGSIKGEFYSRFETLVNVLTYVVLPRLDTDADDRIKTNVDRLFAEFDSHRVPAMRARAAAVHLTRDSSGSILVSIYEMFHLTDEDQINDAFDAIYVLLDSTKKLGEIEKIERDSLVDIVVQQVEWRRRAALVHALRFLARQMIRNKIVLSHETLTRLLVGLGALLRETDLNLEPFSDDVNELMLVRTAAAHLASVLHKFFTAEGQEIPGVIEQWKEICSSPDSFADLRNAWSLA